MGRIGAWFSGLTTGMKAPVVFALVVLLASSGCSNALHDTSAEQAGPPSHSHTESRKAQGPARDKAKSAAPEVIAETGKAAPKKTAEQAAAKPKPRARDLLVALEGCGLHRIASGRLSGKAKLYPALKKSA